jgi:tripeptidyl-peptidase-1
MLFSSLLFAIFAVLTASAPVTPTLVLHETRHDNDVSSRSLRTRRVDGEMLLPIRIALKQRNLDQGYDHVMEISQPSSPKYGQHWYSF